MPELPEVETTVRGLNKRIIGSTIEDIWTDWPKYFKKGSKGSSHLSKSEQRFRNCVKGEEIIGVRRIGKNIIIELSHEKAILVHQKMSGHLLVGKWKEVPKDWESPENVSDKWEGEEYIPDVKTNSYLWNEKNRFVRLIFFLDDKMMALSDLRRFAKVVCGKKQEILEASDITELGPEPLDPNFDATDFKKLFKGRRAIIKNLLLNQKFISGVGNIYADEALWMSKIHPLTKANELNNGQIEDLYNSIVSILKKAVQMKGTSIDDFREPDGAKGKFESELNAYHQDGEKCSRCGAIIDKMKIGARSAHFCPKCQKK